MLKKYKVLIIAAAVCAVLVIGAIVNQFFVLRAAHSTFENYYNFRGCVQLLEKTDTYGICKTSSGDTIKIVEIQGKWYLNGDGPGVW